MKQIIMPDSLKEFPIIHINFEIRISVPNGIFASMDTKTMEKFAYDIKHQYINITVSAFSGLSFTRIASCETGNEKAKNIKEVYAYIDDKCIQRVDVAAVLTISGDYDALSDTRKKRLFSPRFYEFQINGNHYKTWLGVFLEIEDRAKQAKQLFPPKKHGYEVVIAELREYSAPPCEMEVIYSCKSKHFEPKEFNTYEGALFHLSGSYTLDPFSSDGASGYVIPFIRKKDHPQTVLAYLDYNENVFELPHTAYMI